MILNSDQIERKLFDEEAGGEGEGAPATGGTLIGGADDSGAEGEGTPEGEAQAAENAGSEGDTKPGEGEGSEGKEGEGEGEGESKEPEGAPEKYEAFEVPEG